MLGRDRWASHKRATSNAARQIQTPPVALTIAGSDSSAGAGVQADLKTFSTLGVYGLSAVTCVVAEIPGKVSRIEPVSPRMVREQIEVLANSFRIAAIKTGLLCSTEIISTVAKTIRAVRASSAQRLPLVVDPVIVATTGDRLLQRRGIETYTSALFPLASLITPNLDEAECLLGRKIKDRQSMRDAGTELKIQFGSPILLKGGHLRGNDAVDLLFADGDIIEFSARFIRGVATHGTGCTYSAAITAGLAAGLQLEDAIMYAKEFVTQSIGRHFQWRSRTGKILHVLRHSL